MIDCINATLCIYLKYIHYTAAHISGRRDVAHRACYPLAYFKHPGFGPYLYWCACPLCAQFPQSSQRINQATQAVSQQDYMPSAYKKSCNIVEKIPLAALDQLVMSCTAAHFTGRWDSVHNNIRLSLINNDVQAPNCFGGNCVLCTISSKAINIQHKQLRLSDSKTIPLVHRKNCSNTSKIPLAALGHTSWFMNHTAEDGT